LAKTKCAKMCGWLFLFSMAYNELWICFVAIVKQYKLFQFDVAGTSKRQTK
jgi:hypothetical protein